MPAPTKQVARLLREIERLRGDLETVRHVARVQSARRDDGSYRDPILEIVESIADEALKPHRDARRPEDTPH